MTDVTKSFEQDAQIITERMPEIMDELHAGRLAQSLKEMADQKGWTQKDLADKLNVSTAVVNQFLGNKYKGDLEKLCSKVNDLLNVTSRRESRTKGNYVETGVAKKIDALIKQTQAFSGNEEAMIGIVIGDAGHGKSVCLRKYDDVHKSAYYLQADDAMNSTALFSEIAKVCKVDHGGTLTHLKERIIARLKNMECVMLIDEASGLSVKQLNQLRQIITVKARTPLILAGNSDLLKTVMQPSTKKGCESLDQFRSRLCYVLNLDKIAGDKDGGIYTADDIQKLYEYGGVKLTGDAVKMLQGICKTPQSGRLRTCSHLIQALHLAQQVRVFAKINADCIVAAIEQLDLPVRCFLPVATRKAASEQQEMAVAAAG